MLKIAHISDLHLAAPLETFRALLDKRCIGFLNGAVFRKHAYLPERIGTAVRMILEERPDVIVFTGDAVTCSQPAEFELAKEALRPLKESGIPILYSPGNHDVYVKAEECTAARLDFEQFLTGRNRYPAKYETEECTFLICNSAVPTNPLLSCGYLSEETLEFLKLECAAKTKPVILVSHFPVLKQQKGISGYRRRHAGAEPVREMVRSGLIDLVLCGHIHKPYEISSGSGISEICAGSLTKAGIFRIIRYSHCNFQVENKLL